MLFCFMKIPAQRLAQSTPTSDMVPRTVLNLCMCGFWGCSWLRSHRDPEGRVLPCVFACSTHTYRNTDESVCGCIVVFFSSDLLPDVSRRLMFCLFPQPVLTHFKMVPCDWIVQVESISCFARWAQPSVVQQNILSSSIAACLFVGNSGYDGAATLVPQGRMLKKVYSVLSSVDSLNVLVMKVFYYKKQTQYEDKGWLTRREEYSAGV